MTWAWNPWALPFLLAGGATIALGLVVFLQRPDRAQNRALAVLFLTNGVFTAGEGLIALSDDPRLAYAVLYNYWRLLLVLLAAYIAFLSTLETPLARPMGSRAVQFAFGAVGGFFLVSTFTNRTAFYQGSFRLEDGGIWLFSFDDLGASLFLAGTLLLFYALVVVASAYRRAPPGVAKTRARAFTIGFAVHDGLYAIFYSSIVVQMFGLPCYTCNVEGFLLLPLAMLFLAGALAYGILKHQLFDIDLKIKWTVRQGTVVAFFLAAFFVVSELASVLLTERMGTVFGIVSAGALLFLLAPLQRLAERVSDATMPRVADTPEYRAERAREIYRAALEGATEDGAVTDRERDILARLQDELALSACEARALEREVRDAGAGP